MTMDTEGGGPRTLTLLFTDVEGSTRLVEAARGAYSELHATQHRLIRRSVEAHGGRVVETAGDSVFATFDTPARGVCAAVEAQRRLVAHDWPEGWEVRVRMGVHTGVVTPAETGFVGADLHRGARISSAGSGGQILVSATTASLVHGHLPEDVELRDLGQHRLKDVTEAQHLYEVTGARLPEGLPPPRTLRPHNLPASLSSFVGRAGDVRALRALIDAKRLVTLVGPGGVGKTRLALEVAHQLVDRQTDGVWLVELASLRAPERIVDLIATTMGVPEDPGTPRVELLRSGLRTRETLIVLDNCEHLSVEVAELATDLLRCCPDVSILATSRVGLHVEGEVIFGVRPLEVPPAEDSPDDLRRYGSVELFIERSRQVRGSGGFDSAALAEVGDICRHLDGIPLAIELAAARTRSMSVEQIAERLQRHPALLGDSGPRPERHRTLRAAIDWSYDLLDEPQRTLLRRVSIFAGGFTLAACEEVCSGEEIAREDVAIILDELVDRSVVQLTSGSEEPRHRLLETIRWYAAERLTEADEEVSVARSHRRYVAEMVRAASAELNGPGAFPWLERLDEELADIRAALGSALAEGEPEVAQQMVGDLNDYWHRRGRLEEGCAWLDRALIASDDPTPARLSALLARAGMEATLPDPPTSEAVAAEIERLSPIIDGGRTAVRLRLLRAWNEESLDGSEVLLDGLPQELEALGCLSEAAGALHLSAYIATNRGRTRGAMRLLDEAEIFARSAGDPWVITAIRMQRGNVAMYSGDLDEAQRLYEECLREEVRLGDSHCEAHLSLQLSRIARQRGELERAGALIERGLQSMLRSGHVLCTGHALYNLGQLTRMRGDHASARAILREALTVERAQRDRADVSFTLAELAAVAVGLGEPRHAAVLLGATEAFREAVGRGHVLPPREREDLDRTVERLRGMLDRREFDALWREGSAMSYDEAVDHALEDEISTRSVPRTTTTV
jgi:predicted ATPase/class 3 adenylate cyclase/tetratricopeptide (TPR) repeat protein